MAEIGLTQSRTVLHAKGIANDRNVTGQRLFIFLRLGDVGNHLPVLQFNDTVAVLLRKITIVGNDDDQLVFGELFQGIENLLTRRGVQRARRLVRHNDFGGFDQSARDCDTLFLAARKGVGLTLCVAYEIDVLQQSGDCLFVLGFALQLQSQSDVVLDRELVENVILLEDKADERISIAVEIALRERFTASSLYDDFPVGGRVQAAADVEQSGLTATAFPEQEYHTRFGEGKGNVIQRFYVCAAFRFIDFR